MQGTLKTRGTENTCIGVPRAKAAQPLSRKISASESESTHTRQQQTNVSLWGQEGLYTVVLKEIRHKEKVAPLPGSKYLKQLEQEVTF